MKRFILLFILLFCGSVQAQLLSDKQLADKAETVSVGSLLARYNNIEIYKADKGQLQAKVYGNNQYDIDGKPLIEYDSLTGDIKAKGKYVRFVPDAITKTIKMNRVVGNAGIKEDYILLDNKITKLSWTVSTNASVLWNDKDKKHTFKNEKQEYMFEAPSPTAQDANGKDVKVDVTYENNVLTYVITFIGDELFPVMVDPTSVVATNDGFLRASDVVYVTARDLTTANNAVNTTLNNIGQTNNYWVMRPFFSFAIPAMGSCTAGSLFLEGGTDASTTNFGIYLHTATYSNPLAVGDFASFNGHQTSGAYTGTILNDTWDTSSFSLNWNEIVLNAAGLTAVLAKSNSTLQLVALSKEDYDNSAPTGDEYVRFESSITAGKEPYLSITFTLPSVTTRSILSKDGVVTMLKTEGGVTVLKSP